MEYTITLSPAEQKAMEYIAMDVQDWIENSVKNRARIAIDDIFASECDRIANEGGSISGSKEDIVVAAPIQSMREREEALIEEVREREGIN